MFRGIARSWWWMRARCSRMSRACCEMAARGLAGLPLTVILLAGEGRDPAGLGLGRWHPTSRSRRTRR
jgi:hypothetical protein